MVDQTATAPPPELSDLAQDGRLALFLDFDGTLVDIAPSPEAIVVPAGLARSLEDLAVRLEGRVALVSGRSLTNLGFHLGRPAIAIAGSHGLERVWPDGTRQGGRPASVPVAAARAFRAFAAQFDGLHYEAKSHGAALHYRAVPELEETVRAFAAEIAGRNGLAIKYGKCVAEIVPVGADKARAVRAFMREDAFSGAIPIFVGDDLTDEDGFHAATEQGGFGVLVGQRTGTLARYRLSSPAGVREWLDL